MGRTIVIQYVTLDGVVEDPDGRGGTAFGGWAMRHGPAGVAGDRFALGDLMSTGVLLYGRRTWDHFSGLWPSRTTEFAQRMNAATKAVVTGRPLDPAAWENSSAIVGDLADWVAETTAVRDIVVMGSLSVVRSLADKDLVDEYRLLVLPTAVGAGARLFSGPLELELVSSERSGPGTLSTYRGPGR